MHSRDKEVRRLLCGCYEEKQGYLVAVEGFKKTILSEPLLGSFTVRYRGAYYLLREYRINGRADTVLEWIERRIFSLGRPAVLMKRTDDACALRIPRLTNPVFYDMERQEKRLLLRIYTARGVFARLTCMKALKLFEEDMPERLLRCDTEETSRERRQAEKDRQREEKALRRKKPKTEEEEPAEASEEAPEMPEAAATEGGMEAEEPEEAEQEEPEDTEEPEAAGEDDRYTPEAALRVIQNLTPSWLIRKHKRK